MARGPDRGGGSAGAFASASVRMGNRLQAPQYVISHPDPHVFFSAPARLPVHAHAGSTQVQCL